MRIFESIIDLREEKKGDVMIVRVRGRFDAFSAPIVEKKFFETIKNSDCKLLLDFSGVTYLSTVGMRVLLSTTRKMKEKPGRIAVCSLTSNVWDVLKMSGIDNLVELFKNEEDALATFKEN